MKSSSPSSQRSVACVATPTMRKLPLANLFVSSRISPAYVSETNRRIPSYKSGWILGECGTRAEEQLHLLTPKQGSFEKTNAISGITSIADVLGMGHDESNFEDVLQPLSALVRAVASCQQFKSHRRLLRLFHPGYVICDAVSVQQLISTIRWRSNPHTCTPSIPISWCDSIHSELLSCGTERLRY